MLQRISRRTFLAAGAAAVASPLPVLAQSGDADVIIVGAGAAGIAAARRVQAAGRRCVVLEAADRVGGRCVTDTALFGLPCDLGAHTLRGLEASPLAKLGRAAGLDLYPVPPGQKLRVGPRFARENEMELYFATLLRARRALADSADEDDDRPAARALPRDLGDWRPLVEFLLGALVCGKGLDEVSAFDLARLGERDRDGYCRQGYGALLARLAEGLPVRLATPVTRIATWRGLASVETPRGGLSARAVIVTASTGVLAAGKIRFDPALPKDHAEAAAKLSLGSYERVAIALDGNPLGLSADDFVVEKAAGPATAALLANVGGTPLCFVDVAGRFARGRDEAALKGFALDWLAGLFGSDVKKAVRGMQATQWGRAPWVLGAVAAAPPGAHEMRATLAEPVRERIFFAGEATHAAQWGSVGGAWEAGERAADAALRRRATGRPSRRRRRR